MPSHEPSHLLKSVLWGLLGLHIALLFLTLDRFNGLIDSQGLPLGADFITYWAASHLAQFGHPEQAYDALALLASELLVAPIKMPHTGWYYPPQFLLVVYPLAALHYATAYLVFSVTGLLLYLYAFSVMTQRRGILILFIAFPALFLNLLSGQNGLLTVSIAALSLYFLERRPLLAGSMMGLLCIKPQLLLLFPVVLIWSRNWRALSAFTVSSLTFAALATVALGADVWPAFLHGLSLAKTYLETDIPLSRMPTVFALSRQAGTSVALAYALHGLIALTALATVLTIWSRSRCMEIRGMALIAATLLISPYLFDYDLAWHALPMLWLYQLGSRNGWIAGERLVLCITWMLLFYVKLVLYLLTGEVILPGALISLALLWAVYRRSLQTD